MRIHTGQANRTDDSAADFTAENIPTGMGNRFTGLGQSFDWTGHSAGVAQQQAKQLVKAVKVIQ